MYLKYYILISLQIYYTVGGKENIMASFLPVNPLVVGFWQSCKNVTTGQPLIHWLQGFITFRLQHHPGQDHPVFIQTGTPTTSEPESIVKIM